MSNKKPLHLFLGIVLICLGAWFGFIAARATFNLIRNTEGFSNPWLIGILVLWTASGAFCIWMGTREFQRATGQNVKKPTFRWGRMLAGIYLVFVSLKSHVAPSPNAFTADNDAQAAGMLIATIIMILVGLVLIASSFTARKSQSQLESI
ncbi:MAG TPA: hypothetical protein VKV30_10420 [Candidatus Angelobacter sp.]|nr:hypothetical protein [Candidatus Angelobacter sp.]